MTTIVDFNAPRDVVMSHDADWSGRVLHVFDGGWHGIRSATGCLPGHKLAINHAAPFDGEGARHIIGLIHRHRVERVVFQGFSHRALELALLLHDDFGQDLPLFVVTHVSPGQFENRFEMVMLREMFALRSSGVLRKLGSVKPGFAATFDLVDPQLIINAPPRVPADASVDVRDVSAVFIPVENTWRKNLYVNALAALRCPSARRIYAVNEPSGLEDIEDLRRLRIVGFMPPADLLEFMSTVALVMNLTLIECQPMTKLEAAAVGTPCLTGRLDVCGLEDHPYSRLTEIPTPDRADLVKDSMERIHGMWRSDPNELLEMAADYCNRTRELCRASYEAFLEL